MKMTVEHRKTRCNVIQVVEVTNSMAIEYLPSCECYTAPQRSHVTQMRIVAFLGMLQNFFVGLYSATKSESIRTNHSHC